MGESVALAQGVVLQHIKPGGRFRKTQDIARACGAPVKEVRATLGLLHSAGKVDCLILHDRSISKQYPGGIGYWGIRD